MSHPVVQCDVVGTTWLDPEGQPAFFAGNDLHVHPPFYQLLPCPYCGVTEDRNHDPLKHTVAKP